MRNDTWLPDRAHLLHLASFPFFLASLLPACGAHGSSARLPGDPPASAPAAPASGGSDLPVVPAAASCASLKAVDLTAVGGEGSTIVATTETTSDGIPVCLVEGKLAPEVNIQVVLPERTWSQRYLQIGCGGLCGRFTLQSGASDGCTVLGSGGFAMAATDMGHNGQDGLWGLDPQRRIDFAYRAQHLTALAAKALIAAYYGRPQKFAYFNGCSDGGREALMEAQRYPEDFDGVIAGAPAMLFQVQNTLYHGWQALSNTAQDGARILLSDKLPILHRAVVQACDARDGVVDKIIASPADCDFDLASVTCSAGADPSDCLTPAEAEVARRFYEGPSDANTGAHLTAGQPLFGSELNWKGVYVADTKAAPIMSRMAAEPVLRYLAFAQPDAKREVADLAFTEATLAALRPRHPLFDATNTNLAAFQLSGGKLILWHGLADPHIAPANTIALHKALSVQLGTEVLESFERLYLLPGVSHCGGGEGPSHVDLVSAMLAWVERGVAPAEIRTATQGEASSFGQPELDGGKPARALAPAPPMAAGVETLPSMTRPVYPYPYVARYKGFGDYTDAASWEKGEPSESVRLQPWPGEDFFGPYVPAEN